MHGSRVILCAIAMGLVWVGTTGEAIGAEPELNWLTVAQTPPPAPEATTYEPVLAPEGEPDPMYAEEDDFGADERAKAIALGFAVDYTFVSDYVWRGINATEFQGEGHERPCHQLRFGLESDSTDWLDVDLGTVGATAWFQWYGGFLAQTNGQSGDHLQQVDYSLYWKRNVPELGTHFELGWVYRTWPRVHDIAPDVAGDEETTYEVYVKLTFDDSAFFGTEKPVFSPYIYYGLDYDLADEGSWIELGVSHEFILADLEPFSSAPMLNYMKVTPSASLGIDHRYLDSSTLQKISTTARGTRSTKFANLLLGVAFDYDLTGAMGVSEEYGTLNAGAFVYFSDALREDILNDTLYGGVRIGYSW
jgi:hypothetical protein